MEHEPKMCNVHAHERLSLISVTRKNNPKPARSFGNYEVKIAESGLSGVKLIRKVG
jgi:hypothetical protein